MASLIHANGILRQDVYGRFSASLHTVECAHYFVTDQDVYATASLHTGRVCFSRITATTYLDSPCHQPGCVRHSEPTYWSCMC